VFPTVLETLEKTKVQLGIRSFGISATTLEEVFLRFPIRVGEGADTKGDIGQTRASPNDIHRASTSRMIEILVAGKKSSISLFVLQLRALLTKKFIYISRKWKLMIAQVTKPSPFSFASSRHSIHTKHFPFHSQAIIPLGLVLGALFIDKALTAPDPEP
ncbi:unnamed protein product, partial [Darwinula stevensoni]